MNIYSNKLVSNLHYMSSSPNMFIETNFGDHKFIHITQQCVAYHACRARCDELVVTCCVECAVQHLRHSTNDFSCTKNA